MNGTEVAKVVVEGIRSGNKIAAIKAVRALETSIYFDNVKGKDYAVISLLDCKLFVEELMVAFDAMTPDAYEVELSQYKKLREAGFSMNEACKIVDILK